MTPEAGAEMLGEVVGLSVEELKNKVMSKATQGMHILRNAEIETLTNPSPSAPGQSAGHSDRGIEKSVVIQREERRRYRDHPRRTRSRIRRIPRKWHPKDGGAALR